MKRRLCLGLLLIGCAFPAARKPKPALEAGEPNADPRIVHYTQGGRTPKILTMKNWSTTILLPPGEKYLDYWTGEPGTDKNDPPWIVLAPENADYVSISPNKNHLPYTSLTIMTESKNAYLVIAEDVTKKPGAHADTLVKVVLDDEAMQKHVGHKAYVAVEELDAMKALNASLNDKLADQARETTKQIEAIKKQAKIDSATAPRQSYVFKSPKKAKKLGFHAMWTNGERTYADRMPTTETAAFYEIKDGEPLFTNWEYKDGHYFITHKVEKGYFLVGKKKSNKVECQLEGQS